MPVAVLLATLVALLLPLAPLTPASAEEPPPGANTDAASPGALDEFAAIRQRWTQVLTGGPDLDLSIPEVAAKATATAADAQQLWETMDKSSDRTYLWADEPPSSDNSNWINESYRNVRDMAVAFVGEGSDLHGNLELRDDIVSALDWLHLNAFNEDIEVYGNSWNFGIGVQIRMGDILTLMHDHLTPTQVSDFVGALDHFTDEIRPIDTGANLSDKLLSKVLHMVAIGDSDRMEYYSTSAAPLFEYVTSGDGMYRDGSFVQHTRVAATGSYGEVLLRGATNIAYLLTGTSWELPAENQDVLRDWVFDVYEPVIYNGQYMDMVRGRSIATQESAQATAGTMATILRISQFTDAQDARRMQSLVKHWVQSNPTYNYPAGFPIDMIGFAIGILTDDAIAAEGDQPMHRELSNMGRSVHKGNGYAFGVSMSSQRTQTYELTNGSNGKGWYTGDGMTYLYTEDVTHYAEDFWPTVEWHRLPGTTVDTLPRTFDHPQYGDGEGTPRNTWAGGSTLGLYGASGMNLQQIDTGLEANKSWFMFDDEIVAVGSGINSTSGRPIETIIEQRQLNEAGDNSLTVDGATEPSTSGWSENLVDVSWAHLEGNVPGSGIGYYFPEGHDMQAVRQEQTGSWYDINRNDGASQEELRADYMTMYLEHGTNPSDEGYDYVLLPNQEASDVQSYSAAPDVEVLERSAAVHAVRESSLGITAANFFADGPQTVGDLISTNRQASIMVQDAPDHELRVAVSDPTFNNSGAILVEINRSAAAPLSVDPGVTVLQLHPTIELLVSTDGANGRAFDVNFDTDPAKPRSGDSVDLVQPAGEPVDQGWALALAEDDFELNTHYNEPTGWDVTNDPDTLALATSAPGSDNMYAYLFDNSPSGSTGLTRTFEPQHGLADIEFQWVEPAGAAGARVTVGGADQTALMLESADGQLLAHHGDDQVTSIADLDATQWHRIRILADLTAGTFAVHLDGELVHDDLEFTQPRSSEGEQIDSVRFATSEGQIQPLAIDNFLVRIPGGEAILHEDFNDSPTDANPEGWVVSERAGTAPVHVTEVPSQLNKSLILADNDPTFGADVRRSFDPQTGEFTFKWTFMEPNSGKWPNFLLGSGETSAIRIQSNGISLRVVDPDGVAESVGSLDLGDWQTVRLVVSPDTQTFEVFLNGALVKSDAPFVSDVSQIDSFRAYTSYGGVDATLHIDDVLAYRIGPGEDEVPASPTAVEITGDTRVSVGESTPLTATVSPETAVQDVTWSSNEPEVATVSASGELTGLVAGTVTITAASVADPEVIGELELTVAEPSPPDWSVETAYSAGGQVSHDGRVYEAQWWSRGQTPGTSPWDAWAEVGAMVACEDGEVRRWTDSWVHLSGDVVAHDGHRWQAKWWTRNHKPSGDPHGPWIDLGSC